MMNARMAAICAVMTLAIGCGRPPLRSVPLADGFRIDVQTLGEYKTTVVRIRLFCNDRAVWEARADRPTPQIHEFDLRTGENPCYQNDVSEPEYRVVIPAECKTFRVERGAQCTLEVWGGDSVLSRARTVLHFP